MDDATPPEAAPPVPEPSEPPPGYPAEWETDVVLTDGSTVRIRPIRPDDGDRLLDFHARQSPQSIYYRYFSPRPRLSDKDIEHLTHLDYVDRMAFVGVRGDRIMGVSRYDRWQHRSEAEVAFFIDDEMHGRGMATVMLEHLAARARAVGISSFTASVLPENRKMLGVFTAAGFTSATRFADGVVEVSLDLQPTPDAEAAIEARAATAASRAVGRLLAPRSIAVIGASREPGTIGHDLFRNLLRSGFEGPVWPVNPEAVHVASVRAVGSILDIPDEVDLAIVAVPAAVVPQVIEECGRKQVYGAVVASAGFAENGAQGAALEAEVLRLVRRFGMRLLGPASLGLINTDPGVRMHGTAAAPRPLPGQVGLLSESGMIGAAIIDRARELGVGISSFVALGNRSDVSGNDLLRYWAQDDQTAAVCMYIESFGNPRHFSRIAKQLSRRKPVVAVRARREPRTEGPADGPRDPSADVLLEQTGVIRARTLAQLLDVTRLLVHQPLPPGRRVAIVGNAGGTLTIAADACFEARLSLATLAEPTRDALAELSSLGAVGNPLDLGLVAGADDYSRALQAVLADDDVDVVLAVFAPSLGGTAEEVGAALGEASALVPSKPVVACYFGPRQIELARAGGRTIPVYDSVEPAAAALGKVAG
jgi:succinyl-CoA synthetase alpha subunit/RimJ/RimL family protein N-acetyltransferase